MHEKRFYLAKEAPICQGELRGESGYSAVSPAARAVLNGSYEYPEGMDESTKAICEEVARIRLLVPKDSAEYLITKENGRGDGKK